MASALRSWIVLRFLLVITCVVGVRCRVISQLELLSKSSDIAEGQRLLRTDSLRRWRRDSMETHREKCALLAEPWMENNGPQGDLSKPLHLRVLSLPLGGSRSPVFPGQPLFRFIRRVYHCCQRGFHCRSVKGIQGRLIGDTGVEFLLSQDVLAVKVMRAEIHIQLLNPHHLDIEPVIPYMAKRKLPTRYTLWTTDNTLELRVDLLVLFQGLQEAAGGGRGGPSLVDMRKAVGLSRGGPSERPTLQSRQDVDADLLGEGVGPLLATLELGLALNCNKGGVRVSCEHNGLHLLHPPFIALSYR